MSNYPKQTLHAKTSIVNTTTNETTLFVFARHQETSVEKSRADHKN